MGRKFMYDLSQLVKITASGETGYIKGRAEYTDDANGYLILYRAADGRAVTAWWQEADIQPINN